LLAEERENKGIRNFCKGDSWEGTAWGLNRRGVHVCLLRSGGRKGHFQYHEPSISIFGKGKAIEEGGKNEK